MFTNWTLSNGGTRLWGISTLERPMANFGLPGSERIMASSAWGCMIYLQMCIVYIQICVYIYMSMYIANDLYIIQIYKYNYILHVSCRSNTHMFFVLSNLFSNVSRVLRPFANYQWIVLAQPGNKHRSSKLCMDHPSQYRSFSREKPFDYVKVAIENGNL